MNPSAAGNGTNGSRLRPYLTTAQLISLAAFASPIISLLFVLFRLQASGDVAQQSVDQAKDSLQASCQAAERAASVGASLPRYLAQGVNHQITEACIATMEGARIALTLSLTATEALIEFIIDMYRSTFLCLLELVVRGGLSVVIAAVSEITTFLNTTLATITSGITGDINTANSAIQSALGFIKNTPFGGSINIPQFTVPSASQLANIQIPTTFEDQLKSLNNSIPTLEDLREKLDSLIAIPFELVKKEINDTFIASQKSFIATPLPVPLQSTVTFCGDTISSSFDDLGNELVGIARAGIYIVIASMVLLFIGYAFLTWHSQRSLRANIERIRFLWFTDGTATTDRLLAFDALVSHPIWSRVVQFLSQRFHLSQEKYDTLTWFGLYVFHPAPMACLLIGVFGLISVQIQIAIVGPLQSHYSNQISNDITGLTNVIAVKLNDTMYQDSAAYAQTLNAKISAVQTTINSDLFGWVNATIVPLNTTLASFYTEVQDTVNSVFGGSPLEAPAQEFVRCILGSKVIGIEKALTFLQENLRVNLPLVNETALVLSQSNVNEVATPISAAAVGSGDDGEDGGVVGKIISRYIETLEKERITFFIFLLLWAAVVLAALIIITWHTCVNPTLHRGGLKTPRWLAGPSWEDPATYNSDEAGIAEKHQLNDLARTAVPMIAPIPSPLHRHPDAAAKSTSASIVEPDSEQLRQRRARDVKMASDLESFLDTDPQDERPSFFQRLKGISFARKHVAKKNSDTTILPLATPPQPVAPPSDQQRAESGFDWFDRVNFWKRSPSNGEVPDDIPDDVSVASKSALVPNDRLAFLRNQSGRDVSPPSHPRSKRVLNEPRGRPVLTVDVAKASAPGIQPQIVLEHPDRRLEPIHETTPPNLPRSSRRTAEGTLGRDDQHLTVPTSNSRSVAKPTPPGWVIAMKEKESALNGNARSRADSSERAGERMPSGSSGGPRRPPGLESERSRPYPVYPKSAATNNSRDRYPRNDRGERRPARNASIPPRSARAQTDPKNQQQRNRVLAKASLFDAIDPFATPLQASKSLPAPLEPMQLQAPRKGGQSTNPFSTPFDDSHAIKPDVQQNTTTRNFSIPSRR